MSLSTRHVLNTVHPWVAERVRYILDYADNWGPTYSITSGLRTAREQYQLYVDQRGSIPLPGCSQHEYTLAADVWFKDAPWRDWFAASARNFGLTPVTTGHVHVQAVPGSLFRGIVEAQGLCPDPRLRTNDPWASYFSCLRSTPDQPLHLGKQNCWDQLNNPWRT